MQAVIVILLPVEQNRQMSTSGELDTIATRFGNLDCTLVSNAKRKSPPKLGVILCHGFGAPGTDLVPLGEELAALAPETWSNVAYLFPKAPISLDSFGIPGGRAWWLIDIARFQRAMNQPEELARLRRDAPPGMREASDMLLECVRDFQEQTGLATSQLVLGGFSQGSMLAADVAFRLPESPAGLCILSGTLLTEEQWTQAAAQHRSMPVLQSHGRFDPILPFRAAETLRDMLTTVGLKVDFLPFDGPHTIPFEALSRFARFIQRLAS